MVSAAVGMFQNNKKIQEEFAPFQLNFMVKNEFEAVVHLIRRLHEIYGNTHVFFSLDVSSAFNSVSRLHGLLSVAQAFPGLYSYIINTYRRKNKLRMEPIDEQIRESIPSEEVSTKGAVDGGVFFNVAIYYVLKEINAA